MYELIQVGEKTYYIQCPAKMGIYQLNEREVCLIDSGNDKDAGRKIQKILTERDWTLQLILNTHSHADHIGGNQFLQQRCGCPVYAAGIEQAFIKNPVLEPSYLYGGFPGKQLRNKFLMAQPSEVGELAAATLPAGLEALPLAGHAFAMTGLKTSDDVWFLADSLASPAILEKYHIWVLYDVAGYLATLTKLEQLQGRLFIPSHAEPAEDIRPLIELNRRKVEEIIALLLDICRQPAGFDDILKQVFDRYGLTLDYNQYVLVGSTLRSYLSYLQDSDSLQPLFADNRLLWQRC
ncbi:MAG: MBL fold metallo-hydrolase [Sporomusaceae bacterium]|nr:MBL fold metallo-hydrolase [Sporomusaceae bacterium]